MFKLRTVDPSRFDAEGAGDPADGVFGLPYEEEEVSLVLLPVPWEPTVSYGRGTVGGPELIRRASAQLDLFDVELHEYGMPHPWHHGIAMRPSDPELLRRNDEACVLAEPIVAAGGARTHEHRRALEQVNAMCESVAGSVQAQVAAVLDRGQIAAVIGGDHSVSLGAILAYAQRDPALGVLHIDAHADLRVAYEGFTHSHASIMHNVLQRGPKTLSLVQVGVRDLSEEEHRATHADPRIKGAGEFFDFKLRRRLHAGESWASLCEEIVASLPERVYVSLDIDGLAPMYCPNTGTPVPGGLSFGQALTLLHAVVDSGRSIVGFDLVEVSPGADVPGTSMGEWDGNVAARLLYRLCGLCFVSAKRSAAASRVP